MAVTTTTTTTTTKSSLQSSLFLLLLLLPLCASAQFKPWYNLFNFAYGAKAAAMGNAFTAVADDLTASFWNPAGLASGRGPEFYLGYKATAQDHDYELQDRLLPPDTRLFNYNFDGRLNQIDFFAISAPFTLLKRPAALAMGYYRYIPYGFKGAAREVVTSLNGLWPPRRTTTEFAGAEGFDVLAFALAFKPGRFFAAGVTLQQFFNSGRLHVYSDLRGRQTHGDLTESVRGRNLIVGALFTPFDWLRLGAAWHAGLKSRFDSSRLTWEVSAKGVKFDEVAESCQARVVIPEHYAAGLLLRPFSWLDLSADYSRIEWDNAFIEGYYGFSLLPYPQKDYWTRPQQPGRNLRLGGEARLPLARRVLSLRGGWSRESQLYADKQGAAVRLYVASAGAGWEFSRHMQLEATYQHQKADYLEDGYFGLKAEVPTHFRSSVFFLALTYRFGHVFRE